MRNQTAEAIEQFFSDYQSRATGGLLIGTNFGASLLTDGIIATNIDFREAGLVHRLVMAAGSTAGAAAIYAAYFSGSEEAVVAREAEWRQSVQSAANSEGAAGAE